MAGDQVTAGDASVSAGKATGPSKTANAGKAAGPNKATAAVEPATLPDSDPPSLATMSTASWFPFAFWLAAGALTAYMLVHVVSGLGSLLSILLLAVFFATALDPLVTSLVRKGLRRGLAVTVVAFGLLCVIAGFI